MRNAFVCPKMARSGRYIRFLHLLVVTIVIPLSCCCFMQAEAKAEEDRLAKVWDDALAAAAKEGRFALTWQNLGNIKQV